METLLLTDRVQIERKMFCFEVKENPRGRFLKITEDVGGRRDAIIVPTSGIEAFRDALTRAIEASRQVSPAGGMTANP